MSSFSPTTYSIYLYDYTTYSILDHYIGTETIFSYKIIPIVVGSSLNNLIIIVSANYIKIQYRSTVTTVIIFSTLTGVGVTLSSSIFISDSVTMALNQLTITSTFSLTFSNLQVCWFNVQSQLVFNNSINLFDLNINQASTALPSTAEVISRQFYTYGLLIFQFQASGTVQAYSFNYSSVVTVNAISTV